MIKKASVSELLRKARTKKGLSQSEVAKRLGYSSPQFISNWERGLSSPPIPKLKKLCKIYDLPLDHAYHAMLTATLKTVENKLYRDFYGKR
jgi:transcriptional regulator with XRE-family HTH domain